jgi:hypothetical protein
MDEGVLPCDEQSRTIDLGSGVSLDITHAFPIALTLAFAPGATAT